MEVCIEYCKIRAVFVEYLVGFHIWSIYGNILILLECDAIQAVCQSEDAIDNLIQLEVRA